MMQRSSGWITVGDQGPRLQIKNPKIRGASTFFFNPSLLGVALRGACTLHLAEAWPLASAWTVHGSDRIIIGDCSRCWDVGSADLIGAERKT